MTKWHASLMHVKFTFTFSLLLCIGLSHATHPNVRMTINKHFWEICPNDVDKTHGYGCSIMLNIKRIHQVLIWYVYKTLMHILLVLVDHRFETSWTTLIYISKFFSIMPRWGMYLVEILHSFNFINYHFLWHMHRHI